MCDKVPRKLKGSGRDWFTLVLTKMCGKSSKKVEKVAEEIGYPGFDKNVWKSSEKVEKAAE